MTHPLQHGHAHSAVARAAHWARRPLVRAFRVTSESRGVLVSRMLADQVDGAAMYWVQLVLATAIATLGLALGSSAVVLGAMLISPLMMPIVELGMGLAVGSPLLVARSFSRVALSVAIVLFGAAAITLALPFHEVTAPIASRTSPTVLDLLVAICCALMASFAVVASRSNAATTAAGTAVAIALVPPLCVVGFGVGTGQLVLARGAGLLFVASFSAIMLFAVLSFTALGFGELDVADLERAALTESESRSAGVARLRRWLGSRSGGLLRLVLPLLLLALVYLPLRRALEEVAWEVQARQAVARELRDVAREVVRSSVDVVAHRIRVDLIVVDDPEHARTLERPMALRLSAATGVVPDVRVVAVPSADAVREAGRAALAPRPEPIASPELRQSTDRLADVLSQEWPAGFVGPLFDWHLEVGPAGAARVRTIHFGAALGVAAGEMLARDLSAAAGEDIGVIDVALPAEPMSAPSPVDEAWVRRVSPVLDEVGRYDGIYACIGVPAASRARDDAGRGAHDEDDSVREELAGAAASIPGGRARVVEDTAWTFRVQTDPCPDDESVPDAGVDGDSEARLVDAAPDAAQD
jgi:uncharacterized hydrophobic protein (TIGR00271 family)